jgi:hypothetical protein
VPPDSIIGEEDEILFGYEYSFGNGNDVVTGIKHHLVFI